MLELRRLTVVTDDVLTEAGRSDGDVLRRVGVMAAVHNPFAGKYHQDVGPLMELGGEISQKMVARLLEVFGDSPDQIESYGKGALVGVSGEIEHGFAFITRPFANQVRTAFGDATAWMPSNVKRVAVGGKLDVPLAYKRALYVRSHYDTMELTMPDAPLPDEVVVFLVASNRGRLHARIGGLQKHEVLQPDRYSDKD